MTKNTDAAAHAETQEKWLTKIQALLAKAEATDHPEEADSFLAKAQALMAKWAIDDAMLASKGTTDEEIITKAVKLASSFRRQDISLASAIAPSCNVKIYMQSYSPGSPAKVFFVGFETDVERALLLFTSLLIQVGRETAKATVVGDPRPFKKSFRQAYAQRIGSRLREQAKLNETAREHTKSVGLVLVDRKAKVDEYFANLGLSSSRGGRSGFNASGAAAGSAAGNRADLGNKGLASTRGLGA